MAAYQVSWMSGLLNSLSLCAESLRLGLDNRCTFMKIFFLICCCFCCGYIRSLAHPLMNVENATIEQQSNGNNSESSRKEEFRRYLERTHVIDVLTKVLVGLYEEPERPTNAIEYIRKYMGAPPNVDVESIKKENEELKAQVEKLTKELEASKFKGQQLTL
jgi:hypothetical protein